MSEKKGIFGFFKGWSPVNEEEEHQRSYAANKSIEDGNVAPVEQQEELVTDEIEDFAIEKFEEILRLSLFSGKVKCKKRYGFTLQLEVFDAGDDLGRIIGKNGVSLQAYQLLVKFFILRKFQTSIRVLIDAGDYQSRHQSHVKRRALQAADIVISDGEPVELDPMPASDRRFVHMLFEQSKRVKTISEGEGSNRRVVLVRRDD